MKPRYFDPDRSKKLTALFALLFFLAAECRFVPVLYAAPETAEPFVFGAEALELPASIGRVEKSAKGNRDETVIVVQDAHAFGEAQESLRRIAGHFAGKGITLFGLEGAEGRLEPALFRTFPDRRILGRLFGGYIASGELSGAAAASVTDFRKAEYHGVENRQVYEEGLGYFMRALEERDSVLERIRKDISVLDSEKKKSYSTELLELDRHLTRFENEEKDLTALLEALGRHENAVENARERFPHLFAALTEMKEKRENARTDYAALDEAAEKVRRHLTENEERSEFEKRLQAYRTEQIAGAEWARYLSAEAARKKVSLTLPESLEEAARRAERLESLKGAEFFTELKQFAKESKESLFRSDEERRIDAESRRLALFAKAARLELTRPEWEEIRKDSGAQGYGLASSFAFYSNCEAREKEMLGKLLALMREKKSAASVLVAGGFHAEGFMSALRSKGISSALVSPKLTKAEGSKYLDYMRGEVSWKSYFSAENGRADLFDAFSRAAADLLWKEARKKYAPEEQGRLLKLWRDDLLRALNDEGRIGEAGRLTAYIDRLAETNAADGAASFWEARVEEFTGGLRRLEKEKKLDAENIIRLTGPGSSLFSPQHAQFRTAVGSLVPGSFQTIDSGAGVRSELRSAAPAELPAARFYEELRELIDTKAEPEEVVRYFERIQSEYGAAVRVIPSQGQNLRVFAVKIDGRIHLTAVKNPDAPAEAPAQDVVWIDPETQSLFLKPEARGNGHKLYIKEDALKERAYGITPLQDGIYFKVEGPLQSVRLREIERDWRFQPGMVRFIENGIPVWALRNPDNPRDPVIGKFTYVAKYAVKKLMPEGITGGMLLPIFAVKKKGHSPYAPFSFNAFNEDYIDWREAQSFEDFEKKEAARKTAEAEKFERYISENRGRLQSYAEEAAILDLQNSVPGLSDEAAAARPEFKGLVRRHYYNQMIADRQVAAMIEETNEYGFALLFDFPHFYGKDSVDVKRYPDFFYEKSPVNPEWTNPGIVRDGVNENWRDTQFHNWTAEKEADYEFILAPMRRLLRMGAKGGRVDALHLVYGTTAGQMVTGDEPGDDYVARLAALFAEYDALFVAEAEDELWDRVAGFGAATSSMGGDSNPGGEGPVMNVSTHDNSRIWLHFPDSWAFLTRVKTIIDRPNPSRHYTKFVGIAFGDRYGDTVPIKRMEGTESRWDIIEPAPEETERRRYNLGGTLASLAPPYTEAVPHLKNKLLSYLLRIHSGNRDEREAAGKEFEKWLLKFIDSRWPLAPEGRPWPLLQAAALLQHEPLPESSMTAGILLQSFVRQSAAVRRSWLAQELAELSAADPHHDLKKLIHGEGADLKGKPWKRARLAAYLDHHSDLAVRVPVKKGNAAAYIVQAEGKTALLVLEVNERGGMNRDAEIEDELLLGAVPEEKLAPLLGGAKGLFAVTEAESGLPAGWFSAEGDGVYPVKMTAGRAYTFEPLAGYLENLGEGFKDALRYALTERFPEQSEKVVQFAQRFINPWLDEKSFGEFITKLFRMLEIMQIPEGAYVYLVGTAPAESRIARAINEPGFAEEANLGNGLYQAVVPGKGRVVITKTDARPPEEGKTASMFAVTDFLGNRAQVRKTAKRLHGARYRMIVDVLGHVAVDSDIVFEHPEYFQYHFDDNAYGAYELADPKRESLRQSEGELFKPLSTDRYKPGIPMDQDDAHIMKWARQYGEPAGYLVYIDDPKGMIRDRVSKIPGFAWGEVKGRPDQIRVLLRHNWGLGPMNDTVVFNFDHPGFRSWLLAKFKEMLAPASGEEAPVDGFRFDLWDRAPESYRAWLKVELLKMNPDLLLLFEDYRSPEDKQREYDAAAAAVRGLGLPLDEVPLRFYDHVLHQILLQRHWELQGYLKYHETSFESGSRVLFVGNHDSDRVPLAALGGNTAAYLAREWITHTLPGSAMFYFIQALGLQLYGQELLREFTLEAYHALIGRENGDVTIYPGHTADSAMLREFGRLLSAVRRPVFQDGRDLVVFQDAGPFAAYARHHEDPGFGKEAVLVTANLDPAGPRTGTIKINAEERAELPFASASKDEFFLLYDLIGETVYLRTGDELAEFQETLGPSEVRAYLIRKIESPGAPLQALKSRLGLSGIPLSAAERRQLGVSQNERSELRAPDPGPAAKAVITALARRTELTPETAGGLASVIAARGLPETEAALEAEAGNPEYAVIYNVSGGVIAALNEEKKFLAEREDAPARRRAFIARALENMEADVSAFLSERPAARLDYAAAFVLAEDTAPDSELLGWIAEYAERIGEIKSKFPRADVESSLRVIARGVTLERLPEFVKRAGRAGVKIINADSEDAAAQIGLYFERHQNAFLFGQEGAGFVVPGLAGHKLRIVESEVSWTSAFPVSMLLTNELAKDGFRITAETIRRIPEILPGALAAGEALRIKHSALDLIYSGYLAVQKIYTSA